MNNSIIIIDSDSDDESTSSSSTEEYINENSTTLLKNSLKRAVTSTETKINSKNLLPITKSKIINSSTSNASSTTTTTTSSITSKNLKRNNSTSSVNNNNNNNNILSNDNKSSNNKISEDLIVKKRKLSSENLTKTIAAKVSSASATTPTATPIAIKKLTNTNNIEKPPKRIRPIQISTTIDKDNWYQTESPIIALDDNDDSIIVPDIILTSPLLQPTNDHKIDINYDNLMIDEPQTSSIHTSSSSHHNANNNPNNVKECPSSSTTSTSLLNVEIDENKISIPFKGLLQACRDADPSNDMNILIDKKLLKYYFSVHPDFVISKGFTKTILSVTNEIRSQPDLVYLKLKTIVEELKIRRNANNDGGGVLSNEDIITTGSVKRDGQVRRLNIELYKLTKYIEKLESEECDLNDENSSYVKVEKCKKRACEIYEKICDLTGESKHAHRSVKKPIKFHGTDFIQFNRTLEQFVNRTKTFPDYCDVLHCLDHCNKQYGFGLKNEEMKMIAQDAFEKIGKLLQNRRKSDLYETAVHFAGTNSDPALNDPELNQKLLENQKHHVKISQIIDNFAEQQDAKNILKDEDEQEELELNDQNSNSIDGDPSSSTKEVTDNVKNNVTTITDKVKINNNNNNNKRKPNGLNVINKNDNKEEINNEVKKGEVEVIKDDGATNVNYSNLSFKNNLSIKMNNINNSLVKNNNNNKDNNSNSSNLVLESSSSSSSSTALPKSSSLIKTTNLALNNNSKENSKISNKIIEKTNNNLSKNNNNKKLMATTKKITENVKSNTKNNLKLSNSPSTSKSLNNNIEEIVISDEDS